MPRAFLIVMDSVGCGGAPDAAAFGDAGSNTLGHIAEACAAGRAEEGRSGPLRLPVLDALGLGRAIELASGLTAPGLGAEPSGRWGAATEVSKGKDTPSGHWELAGVPVPWDWHYFPDRCPAFPDDLTAEICRRAGTEGILGNRHASGTAVIEELGAEHLRTGWPICYTSADSVLQIAAHEEAFGLDRLLALCAGLAPTLHAMRVGRVIARPFTGAPGSFARTPNRRDYAIAPPAPTLLDIAAAAGRATHAIGKIGDIFSHRGIGQLHKGRDDAALFDRLDALADTAEEGALTFANFVEFDSLYGHRRDVSGYARALEWFDGRAGAFLARLRPGDMALFTADHGNDPTFRGTEHTRERVPVLIAGTGAGPLGLCAYADVAATVAAHLGLSNPGPGRALA
ncbi:phosphopentomutase [[Luteovulum] sphaeroides subsp. megalophilum]|jgi:phosphopentomutase|uniref:phosphopentomutase n=1 Tax=Cereibacter sphaeroides TaxID=1063 RepID=UPI0000663E30|nr:phosphopentomutase [Cereibacter sphaeroides]ABN75368.1 phosphopentomutase [Cereibacter sphaeroides ATCC 17029]AZB63157.1 phosphopentomutase [Cereibacter sphaeroides]AZB67041.1 phosphopentomutase [Cereibacter sphaeroides]SNT08478.1 phosphopentomutase [[Luteovulum] sphaeroides subsp. megalophilum]